MSVLDGPDDVLRSPRRVTAEKDAGLGRHHRRAIHHRHAVLVKVEPDVALDPLERVLLADGEDDVVARQHDSLDQFALLLSVLLGPAQNFHLHPDELAVLEDEALGRMVLDDVHALFLGVLELPRRRLEVFASAPRDDFDVGAAEPPRRPAAVHRRVADSDDEHALADLLDMAEVGRREPLDTYMNVRRGLGSPGKVEILPVWRAAPDEHRVESLCQQIAHARDGRVVPDVDAHVEDVTDLLVEHARRQAE